MEIHFLCRWLQGLKTAQRKARICRFRRKKVPRLLHRILTAKAFEIVQCCRSVKAARTIAETRDAFTSPLIDDRVCAALEMGRQPLLIPCWNFSIQNKQLYLQYKI
ncbi:hypothetical protein [Methylosinus sp. C49]|uniref:hypothetical protein n=1 Tax=Methylosinus sp. C49 TaxID=2699395 RepID=UPI00137A109A|nr:hypothetical protein [Methylosinus sp. C49]